MTPSPQNMVEQNGGVAGADAARRFNKGLLLQNQRIAAHQTSKRRDREDRHGDDHVGHPAAHDGDHRDRQQDPRKGEQHVAKSHNEPVPPALIVASQQPKHRADGRANQHRQYPGGSEICAPTSTRLKYPVPGSRLRTSAPAKVPRSDGRSRNNFPHRTALSMGQRWLPQSATARKYQRPSPPAGDESAARTHARGYGSRRV